jgi:hypothetical protein
MAAIAEPETAERALEVCENPPMAAAQLFQAKAISAARAAHVTSKLRGSKHRFCWLAVML